MGVEGKYTTKSDDSHPMWETVGCYGVSSCYLEMPGV